MTVPTQGGAPDSNTLSDHDLLVQIHAMIVYNVAPQQVDHEARIRRLERIVWLAMGAAAVSGGTIGSLVTGILNGHAN